ncbi:MAG: NAD-binding protein [Candidatus Heimdallarchaeota archaeon]|nr:MAG: NAD-binding protein [Candidatus Heimdallarchaeota archaeon]
MRIFLRSFLLSLYRLRIIIFLFLGTIICGTIIFQLFYHPSFDPQFSGDIIDSIFAILSLLLSMEIFDFPHDGELIIKLLYVIYPFLGLIIIGFGFIELGMAVFTFRYRIHAWNEWLAKSMKDHTILIGLGNVGTRIVHELKEDGIPTTVITKEDVMKTKTELVEELLEDPNIAVVFGDATQISVLKQANVTTARALLSVANDDLVNFKIATKAKAVNRHIRTVIRSFDRDFAQKVTDLFDIDAAISTSAIAAPAFVATSFEDGIIQTLKSKKGDTEFHLVELELSSQFDPIKVGFLEEEYEITIVAINGMAHPDSDDEVESGSKLLLLGEIHAIRTIKARFCT